MSTSKLTAAFAAAIIAATVFAPAVHAAPPAETPGVGLARDEIRPDIPKDPAALAAGADEAPASAGLPGDGSNNLSFANFEDGDIILGFDTWSVGHSGILDGTRNISAWTYCVWSAVKNAPACVTLEQGVKYRSYDYAYGLWVPASTLTQRASARRFASTQIGEPYDLMSPKTDYSRWYCSKLPWAGYKDRAYRDLDANGGYWVTPADLYNDSETYVFASAN